MSDTRFSDIDFLRAISIIGVILVHILFYHLDNSLNIFIWNFFEFVVVGFIFCSGYVLAPLYQDKLNTKRSVFLWYKKRLIRLLIPFYIYLILHYLLILALPNFFSGLGLTRSLTGFIKNALLIDNTGLNWLPLLFIQLTLLFPILLKFWGHKKIIYFYSLLSVFSALIFTFFKIDDQFYKLIMWLPWSLILVISVADSKNKNRNFSIAFSSFLVFGFLFFVLTSLSNPLNLIQHKYPPDLYYLSYSVGLTYLILLISKFKIFQNQVIKKVYTFISQQSYSLFFIHYLILDLLTNLGKRGFVQLSLLEEFLIILTISIVTCKILINVPSRLDELYTKLRSI